MFDTHCRNALDTRIRLSLPQEAEKAKRKTPKAARAMKGV